MNILQPVCYMLFILGLTCSLNMPIIMVCRTADPWVYSKGFVIIATLADWFVIASPPPGVSLS